MKQKKINKTLIIAGVIIGGIIGAVVGLALESMPDQRMVVDESGQLKTISLEQDAPILDR